MSAGAGKTGTVPWLGFLPREMRSAKRIKAHLMHPLKVDLRPHGPSQLFDLQLRTHSDFQTHILSSMQVRKASKGRESKL